MGNFTNLCEKESTASSSPTDEHPLNNERAVEMIPGSLKITRKVSVVLSIAKPRYILEHEVSGLKNASRRIPLGQRTHLKTNSCKDLTMSFLHDLDKELKNIGHLNILDEEDSERENDSEGEACGF